MWPVSAAFGTVTVTCVLATEVIAAIAVEEPNVTLVVPVSVFPYSVTAVPGTPEKTEIASIVGSTRKLADVAVPLGVVTEIAPVTAAGGTRAVICVSESTVKL
jgi:hypothetical protein